MSHNAIVTNNLTKRYSEITAVDNVSFKVKKGEIFGFLGPNGAGKTTTIRMLCTLSRPTSGTATVAGYDIVKNDHRVREHIGLVAEKLIMYDELTARENLKLFGKLYNLSSGELSERTDELLDLVRMEKWANQQIGKFSTGMKQRINVIRALLNKPEILFLDEPTLGLDPQSTSEIRNIIRRINKENGTTIILTTHMMVEADMLCHRLGIIDNGKIAALDTPGNLKSILLDGKSTVMEFQVDFIKPYLKKHLLDKGFIDRVSLTGENRIKIHGRGEESLTSIIDEIRSAGCRIRNINNLEPTLEDVFLHITGKNVRDDASNSKNKMKGPSRHRWKKTSRVR